MKDSKQVWSKIFGFKVGDRVRVKEGHRFSDRTGLWLKSRIEISFGKTGIITRIYRKAPPSIDHPYVIRFDDKEIQEKAFHVFKAEELESLEEEE